MNFDAITDNSAARIIAHAILACQSTGDIHSVLRFHSRTTGLDYTGYLIGCHSQVDDPGEFWTLDLNVLQFDAAQFLGE